MSIAQNIAIWRQALSSLQSLASFATAAQIDLRLVQTPIPHGSAISRVAKELPGTSNHAGIPKLMGLWGIRPVSHTKRRVVDTILVRACGNVNCGIVVFPATALVSLAFLFVR